ncbi:hypothetical protein [Parerythrobacter jejuensis]|uniref:Uncharacterized protein n=1 Tax=Parerythrobacter jejuensis TaxID=795812 RepID=A0A845AQM0_9SPHN|nr:hypothetical protein [Parerythrobacter jejuensis]MXP32600.1 hypothetical protein [Parerythrobacter jejuensis]
MKKRELRADGLIPWAVFAVWVAVAIAISWDDRQFALSGPVGFAKVVLIAVWLGFLAYSWHCMRYENFVKSVREIWDKYWGRQIIVDLYISVFLSIALVFLVTGSIWQTLFWSIAMIPFANQAILLFVILYLDEIIAMLGLLG